MKLAAKRKDAEGHGRVSNGQERNTRKNKRSILIVGLLVLVAGVVGVVSVILAPSTYEMTGKITNEFGVPVEGVKVTAGDSDTQTNAEGAYKLVGLREDDGIKIKIPENFSYQDTEIAVDYEGFKQSGFKKYSMNQDVQLKFAVKDFANELLTNQKFTRHNRIWSMLDEPSQKVYGDASTYEKYFRALFNEYAPNQKLKEYKVIESEITVRPTWKSEQGIDYTNVFEVPYESTYLSGESDNSTLYVVNNGHRLLVASETTPEYYKEMRATLVDEGYLDK